MSHVRRSSYRGGASKDAGIRDAIRRITAPRSPISDARPYGHEGFPCVHCGATFEAQRAHNGKAGKPCLPSRRPRQPRHHGNE